MWAMAAGGTASAQTVTQVSVDGGRSATQRRQPRSQRSADGRYIAFPSDATNLVPNDTNNSIDIFVKDLVLHTVTRVSSAATGRKRPAATTRRTSPPMVATSLHVHHGAGTGGHDPRASASSIAATFYVHDRVPAPPAS